MNTGENLTLPAGHSDPLVFPSGRSAVRQEDPARSRAGALNHQDRIQVIPLPHPLQRGIGGFVPRDERGRVAE